MRFLKNVILKFTLPVFVMAVVVVPQVGGESPPSQKTLAEFCIASFAQSGVCPANVCKVQCVGTSPNEAECVKGCFPVSCTQIKPEACPKDFCSVMTDCSKKKICPYKMAGGSPRCGGLGYSGQDVDCCKGLLSRCGINFLDGNCDMEGLGSVYNLPICIPCGDGVCTNLENHCNCPEDCPKKVIKLEGWGPSK